MSKEWLFIVLLLLWSSLGAARENDTQEHTTHTSSGSMDGLLGDYEDGREGSGTSWQPGSTPMEALHFGRGSWSFMLHGFVNFVYQDESEPRGHSEFFSTNMLMLTARRDVGRGRIGFRAMGTLEPSLGREGYPLLLQTGETADGINPLVDRQHPHDVLMELGATYQRPLGRTDSIFFYIAPIGEPALGPTAFMHRWSSEGNPIAPISHHWLDATHISYGVVTAGWTRSNRVKIEGSVFNGREPDESRWNVEAFRLNSFSGRLTVNPTANWSLQASAAQLETPERLHDGIDVLRTTASVSYNRPLGSGNWQASLAWGRNKRQAREGVPRLGGAATTPGTHVHFQGGSLEPQVQTQGAVVAESAVRLKNAHTFFGRWEWAQKDELFLAADRRHNLVFDVMKLSAGYLFELPSWSGAKLGVGAYASWHNVPDDLVFVYGERPRALAVFARVRLH